MSLSFPDVLYLPDAGYLKFSCEDGARYTIVYKYKETTFSWWFEGSVSEDKLIYSISDLNVVGDNREAREKVVFILWATAYAFFNTFPAANIRTGKPQRDLTLEYNVKANADATTTMLTREQLDLLEAHGILYTTDTSVYGLPESYFITRKMFWQLEQFPFLPYVNHCNPNFMTRPKPLAYTSTTPSSTGLYVRHPVRPRPPVRNKDFYRRYCPSVESFLIFRTASRDHVPILNTWMNNERVNKFWGEAGPQSKQAEFLANNSKLSWSFPVIGYWASARFPDREVESFGKKDYGWNTEEPFGYFEIYWAKEDKLSGYTEVKDFDRGVHVLVGNEKFRGAHRVREWLGGLIHYMFNADPRTETILLEPRVDNTRFIELLTEAGFYREKEINFPHKKSAVMKLKREAWEGLGPVEKVSE